MSPTDIVSVCGTDPDATRFRKVVLTLEAAGGWATDIESYLLAGDEDGYERTIALRDAYLDGGDVPPVVFAWFADQTPGEGDIQVLDGLHRLAAARSAGLTQLPAFEALQG